MYGHLMGIAIPSFVAETKKANTMLFLHYLMTVVMNGKRKNMSRDFGIWMKNRRISKSMSQMRLAKKVGVHYNSIIRWESGTQFPTLDMAERIIEVLDGRLILED